MVAVQQRSSFQVNDSYTGLRLPEQLTAKDPEALRVWLQTGEHAAGGQQVLRGVLYRPCGAFTQEVCAAAVVSAARYRPVVMVAAGMG